MNKQIIHFGQDPHKPEFYNLIVLATNIGSIDLTKNILDDLFIKDFTIYYFDEYQIEAAYKNKYQKVLDKFRELDKTGWKYKVYK
jgi:hypothetical protein